jgi:hypothetical protein
MYARSIIVIVASLFIGALAGTTDEGIKWLATKEKEDGVIKVGRTSVGAMKVTLKCKKFSQQISVSAP